MSPIPNSSLSLAVYLLLSGGGMAQAPKSVIDLDRVADLLKFPRSELIIIDYLDKEKFIYTKKTSTEDDRGQIPPVDPESIYQSYWIASKTPNALLPIVVTISKPDAYLTPKVKEMIEGLNTYAATQRYQGVSCPYGDFQLPEASRASIFLEEIRVPAHSNRVIEPNDTWSRLDEYPKFHPATVSIVRDASNVVDVRIALYACLYYPDKLIKLSGGEDYYAAFNDDPEDNPKENPLLNIFKGLNQIVLSSEVMNPYRKMAISKPRFLESPKAEEVKSEHTQQETPAIPRQLTHVTGTQYTLKILAIFMLILGVITAVVFGIRSKRI